MTKQEYDAYEKKVNAFFEREGIDNLSSINEEPFFSKRTCDCCQTPFGGNREEANGFNPTTKEIQEYVVCQDCLYYAEFGQLDDTTMMNLS